MNIKNILNKGKEAIKSGVDKGVKNSKELYELSKKRANSEIHKQTKSIATKVIDDTISKAKSSADKSKLKDAKSIVKKVYEKGGHVGKGELVWGKLSSSAKADFLRENFTPLITPRTQEILVGKAYNFLPKQVKIKFEAKYADFEEYEDGGKVGTIKLKKGEYVLVNAGYHKNDKAEIIGLGERETGVDSGIKVKFEDGKKAIVFLTDISPISKYKIFEGHDPFNNKPLYQVISTNEDNDYVGEWHTDRDDAEKELKELKKEYAKGGSITNEENVQMVMNNNNQIKHHTEELSNAVMKSKHVPAWVVSKVNRSASDLSDATHYLDGENEHDKYEDGGEVSNGDVKFNYMMLDRLRSDCDYYLGNGNRSERILRGENVNEHIKEMKKLWNSLPDDGKPEWLSMEDIEEYERKMKNEYEDGGSINNGEHGAIIDWQNFTLNELNEFLNYWSIGKGEIEINLFAPKGIDYVKSIDYKKYGNEKLSVGDVGKQAIITKGSENIYLDITVYNEKNEEYKIGLYSKENHKGLKEIAQDIIVKFEKGGIVERTYSSAKTIGKESQDFKSEGIDYVGGIREWNKLTEEEQRQIIVDLEKNWERNKFEKGGTIQDANSIFKKYEKNEDNNYHAENVLLLAKHFGTDEDIDTATKIIKERNKVGYVPKNMSDKSSEISSRLYPKLIQALNKTNDKPNTNIMTQEQIQELVGITKSTNKVASEIATKKLKQLGLDANGKEIKAEEPKQVRKVVAKKVMPKKVATAPKKVEKSNEPDCDDLYEQYAKRQKAQKKAKNAPQKTETTKNKEKIEKVEDSLDAQFKSGKLTKAMLQKMYTETKALLAKIEKYLAKL